MNKKILVIVVAVLAIGAGIALVALQDKIPSTSNNSGSNGQSTTGDYAVKKSCDVFTLAEAKQFIGAKAKFSGSNTEPVSENVTTSSCTYTTETMSANTSIKTLTVEVRSPGNTAGNSENKAALETFSDEGKKAEGYDNAYWVASLGQLHVLSNNLLLSVSMNTTTIPTATTKPSTDQDFEAKPVTFEETKKIMDAFLGKL